MPQPGEQYQINGRNIITPTQFTWLSRPVVDQQGDNRPIYAPVRQAQLRWQLEFYEEASILLATFNEMQASGTAVVRIPALPNFTPYPAATGTPYQFREYSGCTLSEPQLGAFFEGFPTEVLLVINNIFTG